MLTKSRAGTLRVALPSFAASLTALLLLVFGWPSVAHAEVVVWVKFPGGATKQCSTAKVGRFTAEGTGLVTITTTVIPYKALGRSPNIPTGYWVVGPGQPSFGPGHPLPGFDHSEYTQAGQDVSNKAWADGVPLVVKSFYKLMEAKRHVVDVQVSPQCWMMPQNVYWQEGQEVRVEVNAEGGARVTATPPKDSETVEGEPAPGGDAGQIVEIWNTAACEFTDTATLSLDRPTNLNRVEVWYKWQPNETVSYTLSLNGNVIRSGSLTRGECDAYQRDWCIASDQINMNLAPGTYSLRTQRAGICQNSGSGGKGFIRAFGTPVDESEGPTGGGAGTAGNLAGTWDTTFGLATLQQDGAAVRGNYSTDGRVEGTLQGNVLDGYWSQAWSQQPCDSEKLGTRFWGRLRWTFTDNNSFKGDYGFCEKEPTSSWNGTRRSN
jgi:hypothetical protein